MTLKDNMCPVQTCVTHLLVMSESSLLWRDLCQTNLHWPAIPSVKKANLQLSASPRCRCCLHWDLAEFNSLITGRSIFLTQGQTAL